MWTWAVWNPRFPLHQSRRSTQPESSGEHWSSYGGLSPPHPTPLAMHHFQDTTAISTPGSSSPSWRHRKFSQSVGTEPIILGPAITLPQTSPWATPPSVSPGSAHSTHQPFQLTESRTPEAGSTSCIKWPLSSSEGDLTSLSKELLQLQEEMNTALGELLEVGHGLPPQELDLGAELAACHNDAQLTKAKACHTKGSPGQCFSTELRSNGWGGANMPSFLQRSSKLSS